MKSQKLYAVVDKETGEFIFCNFFKTEEAARQYSSYFTSSTIVEVNTVWKWENSDFAWHIVSVSKVNLITGWYIKGEEGAINELTTDKYKSTFFKTQEEAQKHCDDLSSSVGRGIYWVVRTFKGELVDGPTFLTGRIKEPIEDAKSLYQQIVEIYKSRVDRLENLRANDAASLWELEDAQLSLLQAKINLIK